MKYVIDFAMMKNGVKLYKLYIVVGDKKYFITSFFKNRYNRKATNYIDDSFDFDTWLENQPDGTFVQCCGLDTAKENDNK